jgi:hypothetical protein
MGSPPQLKRREPFVRQLPWWYGRKFHPPRCNGDGSLKNKVSGKPGPGIALLLVQRYSMCTLWSAAKSTSCRPSRNAAALRS